MRRRTQRILISLLAFFIAGFAMANAYTFEVINWSPFGVLNLEKLILKQRPNSTGIILDGKEYTIKIDPEHESEGAIRVDQICDESGVNCKKVSELGIGGGGAIVIDGNVENFCFKKDDTTLFCDNEFLRRLIESWGLGGSINIDGQDKNYCYRLRETNTLYCDNSDIPGGNGSTPGNGKITIIQGSNSRNFNLNDSGNQEITLSNGGGTTSGAIAYGSGEYICVKNGDNLMCNKAKLGTLENNSRCTFDGTSINCTEDTPGSGNANNPTIIITQGGVEKGRFTLNQTSDKTIPLDAGGNGPTISGNSGQRCKYICDKTEGQGGKQVCVSGHIACYESEPTCQGSCNEGGAGMLSGSAGGRCRYGAIVNGTRISWNLGDLEGIIKTGIICTEPAPTGGGDSLWTGNSEKLYPINSNNKTVYIGQNAGLYNASNAVLAVNGETVFSDPGASAGSPISVAKIGSGGVRLFGLIDFYMEDTSTAKKTYGLTVAGPVAIGYDKSQRGTTGNYIYMYANGTGGSNSRHYEIMGSNELAVGVLSGGFMFFRSNATAGNNNNRKYSIGINTLNPQATLDVNGTIKVSATCAITCKGETEGTIAYSNTHFYGCRNAGTTLAPNYKWTQLDGTTAIGDTLSAGTSCLQAIPRNAQAQIVRPVDPSAAY